MDRADYWPRLIVGTVGMVIGVVVLAYALFDDDWRFAVVGAALFLAFGFVTAGLRRGAVELEPAQGTVKAEADFGQQEPPAP